MPRVGSVPFESPVSLSDEEQESAGAVARVFTDLREAAEKEGAVCVKIRAGDRGDGQRELSVPLAAFKLFEGILHHLADGRPVGIVPHQYELTTQQAADLLNVSRPYLIELLKQGKIKYRMVGNRRRVLFEDLMEYKQERATHARHLLEKLTGQAQDLGLGYE